MRIVDIAGKYRRLRHSGQLRLLKQVISYI